MFSAFGDPHQLPGKSALAVVLASPGDQSRGPGRGGGALCIQGKGAIASPYACASVL